MREIPVECPGAGLIGQCLDGCHVYLEGLLCKLQGDMGDGCNREDLGTGPLRFTIPLPGLRGGLGWVRALGSVEFAI